MEPKACVPSIDGWNFPYLQERYIFRTHHDIAHHDIGNPPATPTMKGIPLWPVGKGFLGVFQRCVETTLDIVPFGSRQTLIFIPQPESLRHLGDTNPWSEKEHLFGMTQQPVVFQTAMKFAQNVYIWYIYLLWRVDFYGNKKLMI